MQDITLSLLLARGDLHDQSLALTAIVQIVKNQMHILCCNIFINISKNKVENLYEIKNIIFNERVIYAFDCYYLAAQFIN